MLAYLLSLQQIRKRPSTFEQSPNSLSFYRRQQHTPSIPERKFPKHACSWDLIYKKKFAQVIVLSIQSYCFSACLTYLFCFTSYGGNTWLCQAIISLIPATYRQIWLLFLPCRYIKILIGMFSICRCRVLTHNFVIRRLLLYNAFTFCKSLYSHLSMTPGKLTH